MPRAGPVICSPATAIVHAHYARVGFKAFDGTLTTSEAQVVIDIAAVADLPSLRSATLDPVPALEDAIVGLPAVEAALRDVDGSETLVLTLAGLPIDAILSDGLHRFVASVQHRVLDLTGWNLAALQLTPPLDFNGRLVLEIQATAIEGSTGERATASESVTIEIVAAADAPQLSLGRAVSMSAAASSPRAGKHRPTRPLRRPSSTRRASRAGRSSLAAAPTAARRSRSGPPATACATWQATTSPYAPTLTTAANG
jgi:hypothetical protein